MDDDKKQEKPTKQSSEPTKNKCNTKWIILILILMLVLGVSGTYLWFAKKYTEMKKQKDDQIAQLQQSKKDLEKQVADAKSGNQDSEDDEKPACLSPSVDEVDNIEASITSGNTAALEGYMATKVNVILAASEGIGERTPAQSVSDITSFINGTGAWDFDLPDATLDSYSGGFYAQYFPEGAVIGKSNNSKVISFSFDCNGKIKTVFLATSADILTE